MFKDFNKYLSTSLKVYLFVLVFIFILKLVGLDYFGVDVTNPTMVKINQFPLLIILVFIFYLSIIAFNYILYLIFQYY